QLAHFHLGSQITNIRSIKEGLAEGGRMFVELAIDDYTRNSFGAAQGGAYGALAAAAAEAALQAPCGGPVEALDLQLTYLELGKVGPLRTRTTVLRASGDEGAARVEVFDMGSGGVRTTWATVGCRR
ncbi:MAG TPA: hypothetical protein VF152_13285, partial [Acidimicrobiia bacterium]